MFSQLFGINLLGLRPIWRAISCIFVVLNFLMPYQGFSQEHSIYLDDEPLNEEKICSKCLNAKYFFQTSRNKLPTSAFLTAAETRPYDVLRYDLTLDWMNPLQSTRETGTDRIYTGKQEITLVLGSTWNTQGNNTLFFDAPEDQIHIDSAFIGSIKTLVKRTNTPSLAQTISLQAERFRAHDTLVLTLFFTHISANNPEDGTGFLLYRKGRLGAIRTGNDSVFIPERLAYTMSQPYGARRWMPCNDVPFDKALATIRIRVPQGFTAVANGLLQSRTKDSLGGETFFWKHQYPVAPYLMAVSASVFTTYREHYQKVSNPNDSVPISHYFWAIDDNSLPLNNRNYNARRSFEITRGTIDAYARWFGEYPYESYGHVVVQPFFAGGMEHQTMSTINRAWLRGSSAAGIAHEIIHQWYGNKVTCRSWEDIWLNEGTATYGEALWYESWGGTAWNMVAMDGFRRNYFTSRTRLQSVYVSNPTTIDGIFNYATTYCKGGWIHHLLRRVYGDSIYFPAMRLFVNRFAFGAATTPDFTTVFRETIGKKLVPVPVDTLIKEWVYGSGEPLFSAAWRALEPNSSSKNKIQVTLSQLQRGENIPEVFHLPVEITFWKYSLDKRDTQRLVQTIVMNTRTETRTFELPFLPDSLVIDESQNILCQKFTLPRVLNEENIGVLLSPAPFKANDIAGIDIQLPEQDYLRLEVYSVLGQLLTVLFDGLASGGVQSFREKLSLPSGTYFLRVQTSKGTVTVRKFLVAP